MIDTSTLRLRESDRGALLGHFLALGTEDRRLRFGGAVSDDVLARYVARIDFSRDCVFAVHDDSPRPVAVVHVAVTGAEAELGLSVLPGWRGMGHGDALFMRAATWLRNRGIRSVRVQCLAENAPMLHLARKHGMRTTSAGSEAGARLEIGAPTPQSHAAEWLEDQRALSALLVRHSARRMQALFTKPAAKAP
jgi:GNAT superfamily N-acetyltransferase